MIRIGSPPGENFCKWSISTKEFREELTWAVVVGEAENSPAVVVLLGELAARGVKPAVYA